MVIHISARTRFLASRTRLSWRSLNQIQLRLFRLFQAFGTTLRLRLQAKIKLPAVSVPIRRKLPLWHKAQAHRRREEPRSRGLMRRRSGVRAPRSRIRCLPRSKRIFTRTPWERRTQGPVRLDVLARERASASGVVKRMMRWLTNVRRRMSFSLGEFCRSHVRRHHWKSRLCRRTGLATVLDGA
jgi:hypothetical protein